MLPSVIMMIADEDDREFMTQLFMKYRRIMFSEISKILPDPQDAEDVLQNALIRLCDKVALLRELDERKKINYTITTVRNQAKNYIRDRSPVPLCSFDDENLNLADSVSSDVDIEQEIIIKEQLKSLSSIWDLLDEKSQTLLEGKYILRKSDEQLGKDLGLNASSIRMMLSRARRKALQLMTDHKVKQ